MTKVRLFLKVIIAKKREQKYYQFKDYTSNTQQLELSLNL